ncbi:uncharacterized protein MCYG_01523 [Microsporum canis CBS 113480]|uniref:Uncharacterized protein n=1 Tax=Arthroderma otae (strain ATCC MYA-4605 / CBS 113480) TaxID=554155 RepID=C5FHG4_ARTOC|nr:uncharacterized protein MCYG_01523 [Microsporum canis CBS 113480]EEQ28704.1 hypothetical protein MCYG_01523 [Microsporum canis CBS 113480]
MADFPTLKPAFTMQVLIDPPMNVGSTAKNCNFVVTPMTGGTVKSEPGFSPAFNGKLASNGNDYIRTDPDETGASVYINYTGVVELTPEIGAILTGQSESASTPFGNIFITLKFESGDADHAALENGIFVASGRFIYEKGKQPIVDYKVSQVCKG